MMPNHAARGAFPSLHAAVSCLSLYYARKYCPRFFPFLLIFVVGLLVSTVYLRHHWVVDLLAGAALVPWVLWLTPRFERFWAARFTARRDVDDAGSSATAGCHVAALSHVAVRRD